MEFGWPALPDWFWYPVFFIYGAIVGSFLNVVIYRLPLEKNLSNPPSHCPYCNDKLGFWDNIPLLSFLFLKARCRNPKCRVPISWRYFCVELFTACVFVALYHQMAITFFNPTELTIVAWLDIIGQCLFAAILISLVFIDLDYFIAPDQLNLIGGLIAVGRAVLCIGIAFLAQSPQLAQPFLHLGWLPQALTGAITYGGLLFLVSLFTFMHYAREDNESTSAVFVRYFKEHFGPEESVIEKTGIVGSVVLPASKEGAATSTDSNHEEAPRLAFAPAFLCALSALLTLPFLKGYAPLVFLIPCVAFVFLTRHEGESLGFAFGRFFRSNDLAGPMSPQDTDKLQAMEEAQQFADEAEEGKGGGMGLGDVKLALGIGALLGPGMSILSLLIATGIGAITGGTIAAMHRRKNLKLALPFVPFMAAGALVVMLYGTPIWSWYSQFLHPQEVNTANTVDLAYIRRQQQAEQRRLRGLVAPRASESHNPVPNTKLP